MFDFDVDDVDVVAAVGVVVDDADVVASVVAVVVVVLQFGCPVVTCHFGGAFDCDWRFFLFILDGREPVGICWVGALSFDLPSCC